MKQQFERSPSESYFWPVVLAVVLHVLIFAMLFVSWAFAPELPPSKPIVQATLYQLKSKSQATTQTNQKIAGEAKKTASKQYEVEQLEQKKLEQQKLEQQKLEQQQVAAAKAAEQKKADEARKAEAQKAAEAKKADEAKKAAEAKAAEQKKQADIAKKRAEDEAKKKAADDAKKKAAEDAKKKAAEEAKKKAAAEAAKKKAAVEAAKKKAADDAKKKAAEDAKKKAAEEAKKKAAAEAAKKKAAVEAAKKKAAAAAAAARKAAEDKKAQALAELLSDTTERQQALADEVGSEVTGSLDDLIVNLVSQQWRRPPSARNGMSVEVLIEMLPDGTITNASVSRSSGDKPFDSSAVAAVRNVGRIPEMQQLPRATFDSLYRQRRIIFKPEDLSL
ncbi:cell envelope integrity protein TolA [Pseudomonas aeruginosa]